VVFYLQLWTKWEIQSLRLQNTQKTALLGVVSLFDGKAEPARGFVIKLRNQGAARGFLFATLD